MTIRTRFFTRTMAVWLGLALFACSADAEKREPHPGYVNCSQILDIFDDDDVRIEIHLSGRLLRAALGFDSDLTSMVRGLEKIDALIAVAEDDATLAEAKSMFRRMDAELRDAGWETIARVREGGDDVRVLVLEDEEQIVGVVVLVLGIDGVGDGTEVVCTNIAGSVDLAALRELGEEFEIPGLDEFDDHSDDDSDDDDGKKGDGEDSE